MERHSRKEQNSEVQQLIKEDTPEAADTFASAMSATRNEDRACLRAMLGDPGTFPRRFGRFGGLNVARVASCESGA